MLRLSDVHASYGAASVLQGVSLGVAQGETVALLGPNGAGKSTLMAAITGTLRHRRGEIAFDGRDLVHEPAHAVVEAGVRLVPEGRLVFAPFTVQDNLRLGAVRLRGDLRERFDYVYQLFPRLYERRRQPAGTLSGGEQQMLAVGRALMSKPRLLLLDEPFTGLDEAARTTLRARLDGVRAAGAIVLLTTHDTAAVTGLTDASVSLVEGRRVVRPPDGLRTETGDAPALQGATSEHTRGM